MAFDEGRVGDVRANGDDYAVNDKELTASSALSGCERRGGKDDDGIDLTAGQKDRRTARRKDEEVEEEQAYLDEMRPE